MPFLIWCLLQPCPKTWPSKTTSATLSIFWLLHFTRFNGYLHYSVFFINDHNFEPFLCQLFIFFYKSLKVITTLLIWRRQQWWGNPNHDLILIMIESLVMIWFEYKRSDLETWFHMDLISFHVIWFGDLNKSQLSVIWAKEWLLCWCFYCSWVELLISAIVPSLIFAETLTVKPDVHWWHFVHRLESVTVIVIWFVICIQVIWIWFHFMLFDLWFGIMILIFFVK